eukprot:3755415-Amphidinium_carterae.1
MGSATRPTPYWDLTIRALACAGNPRARIAAWFAGRDDSLFWARHLQAAHWVSTPKSLAVILAGGNLPARHTFTRNLFTLAPLQTRMYASSHRIQSVGRASDLLNIQKFQGNRGRSQLEDCSLNLSKVAFTDVPSVNPSTFA